MAPRAIESASSVVHPISGLPVPEPPPGAVCLLLCISAETASPPSLSALPTISSWKPENGVRQRRRGVRRTRFSFWKNQFSDCQTVFSDCQRCFGSRKTRSATRPGWISVCRIPSSTSQSRRGAKKPHRSVSPALRPGGTTPFDVVEKSGDLKKGWTTLAVV